MEKVDQKPVEQTAKAEKAKTVRRNGQRRKRGIPVPTGVVTWYLFGLTDDKGGCDKVGEYPNRYRLAKAYQAMQPMFSRLYVGVVVVRGRCYDVETL